MMAKKEKKKIGVYIDLTMNLFIEIDADTLEEGLTKARELKSEDIISTDGQINDYSIVINGVQQ